MAQAKVPAKQAVEGEVISSGVVVRTAEEYAEYSKANGRTSFGNEIGVKVDFRPEELRALINSNWKPSMVMEKFQIDEEELKQAVWQLSKLELRDKPVHFDVKNDFFRK